MWVRSSTMWLTNSLENLQERVERCLSRVIYGVACMFWLLTLVLLWPAMATAYPQMVFEQEPDDSVEQAQSFRGEARLVGEVSGDDRDHFAWRLDDAETDRLWHLELQGDGESDLDVELFWPGEEEASSSGVATFGADPVTEASDDVSLLTLSVTSRNDRMMREPLIVPAGEHLIRFVPQEIGGEYRLTLTSGDRINIRGTVGPDEADDIAVDARRHWYFQLDVSEFAIPLVAEGDARQLWRVVVLGELGVPLEAWIEDVDGEVIAAAVEGSPLWQQWGQLELPEGSSLHIRHSEGGDIGRLGARLVEDGWRRDESISTDEVAEPDLKQEEPTAAGSPETRRWFEVGEEVSLTMGRKDRRYLAFQAGQGEALTLGVSVDDSEPLLEVCLRELGSSGEVCREGVSESLFERMSLPAGDYALALRRSGRSDETLAYTVSLNEATPVAQGVVSRPNDAREWALPLVADEPIRGHFEGSGEAWFALRVGGETQQWEISSEGESLERLSLYHDGENTTFIDNRGSRSGDEDLWLEHVRLLPGRYLLRLVGEQTEYRLLASPTGQPQPGAEQEPNDEDGDANPLWLGEQVQGSFHALRDEDRFHFHLPGWNRVTLELEPPEDGELDARLFWQEQSMLRVSGQDEPLSVDQWLPPGDYILMLEGGQVSRARYHAKVSVSDPWTHEDMPAAPAITMRLETPTERLAPFAALGQRLDSRLILNNPGEESLLLALESHISHSGATVSGLPDSVELVPGEEVELPLDWTFPPNMLESAPLSLFIQAGDHVLQHDLPLDPRAPPVEPFTRPDVPMALAGLTNLAWSALGAAFVDPDSGEPIDDLLQRRSGFAHFLIDGMAGSGSSIRVESDLGEALPPIRLAGDGGRVLGIVFNQRSTHAHRNRWREVDIALGDSHDALEVVETLELASADGEQFFEFAAPRDARYVQLRPLSVWNDGEEVRGAHGSGLLIVLGEPSGELGRRHHDLLDHELGGHWVYTLPDIGSLYGFQGHRSTSGGIMDERAVRRGERIRGRTIEMVFAFLHQRAARIGELQWVENLDWEGLPVTGAKVYTATESPVGPWQEQADWTFERDGQGVASLALPESPRARYVRLVFDEPEIPEGERRASWRIPEALRAYEADSLGSGRSVLGHWGMDHSRGPLEAGQPPSELSLVEVEDTHSHADAPLLVERRITGRVEEPGDTRHYRVDLAEGDNTLAFALQESQRGRLQASLSDPEGSEVALNWRDAESGKRHAEAGDLTPGTYQLTVAEPPRSVVFLWDGSGSVSSHQPSIYQALNRFAEGLKPGREVANLLPLGGPLLIDGWAESPAQVSRTLNAYSGRFSDSDSDPALALASRALANQQGEKAIFLITDAEQLGREMSVWQRLEGVRPRIFTLEIGHGSRRETSEYRWYQDQMLSWANVADGRYDYTTNRSELIRAFEAGMRELRQPTTFALEVERRYQEPPEPGSLRVTSGEAPVVAAGAVQLIFDASGSMLQRMEGGRRIDVARDIVKRVLDERVPASVPVALRAFGHTEPHSCETELLVAPGDDNHAQVRRAVEGIQAINLARTPLADSLDEVLDDLDDYQDQRRLVVMLTDGEETCEGDLAQSVERLVEEGVDVRLNIVGFHIDEIGLQEEFERFATQGGGEYFDSQDGSELNQGLADALAATWRVLDSESETIADGRVDGKARSLPPGDYTLVVEAHDGERHQTFNMAPRQTMELRLDDVPAETSP